MTRSIFLFGSNLRGYHGAGSALHALNNHGAILGQGIGLQGDSYAIPTKDEDLEVLPLATIKQYVDDFIAFAQDHSDIQFNIVAIGCGFAGYKPHHIAPMFKGAPENCILPPEFKEEK